MISSRSWRDNDKVREMMSRTSYIGADEAKECGLCDEVIDSGNTIENSDMEAIKLAADKELKLILNKVKEENKEANKPKQAMTKEQICALLKLDAATTTEADATAALNKYVADSEATKAKNAELEQKIKDEADAKATAKAAEEKTAARLALKGQIEAINSERSLNLEAAEVDAYTDIAEKSGIEVAKVALNKIPSVKKAPVFTPVAGAGKEASFIVNKEGGVSDTVDIIRHMNSQAKANAAKRFPISK